MSKVDAEDSPVEMSVETVSPTASDVGSMSDSPVRTQDQLKKKKKRGLSFKKIRSNAQKLIPGRKKGEKGEAEGESSQEGPPPSPPPTPKLTEMKSTESLPAIKEEQPPLQTTKSIDELSGDRKPKKARKPSRAASFVKKLAGRKAKVAPNPAKPTSGEDEMSASTSETPLSIKRRTPEGANLSVSETSLYEPGGEKPVESFKIEQLEREPKVVRTISPKRTEMKLTLINNQQPSESSSTEGSSKASSVGGVQLQSTAASMNAAPSPSLSSSSSAASPSLSPPSSPQTSAGTGEVDKATRPTSSVASVGESSSDATAAASAANISSENPNPISLDRPTKVITTAIDGSIAISSNKEVIRPTTTGTTISQLLSGDYIAEINKFSIEKISTVDKSLITPTPRERFFQSPLNGNATQLQSPQDPPEADNVIETLEVDDNTLKVDATPPEESQPQQPPPQPAATTTSSATSRFKNIFMKKDTQKKSSASTPSTSTGSSSSSSPPTPAQQQQQPDPPGTNLPKKPTSPTTTVRTQEAAKPYQLGNNIKNPNLPGFKSSEPNSLLETSEKPDPIVFNIGSKVRPNRTSSAKQPSEGSKLLATDIPVAPLSGNFNASKSLEESSSLSAADGPLSENSRRRIAYVAQPTLFTPEEEELARGRPSLASSAGGGTATEGDFSIEKSSDFLEATATGKMSPHGDLLLDKGSENLNMAAPTEKHEHLYKILVIGELGTGKTSFIKRYVHQFFTQSYRATIGVDFALKVLNWDQNTIIRLQLWDIAGQERFGNMTRVYYKEAVGAFIVFDVTRSATFDAVIKWKNDLDAKVQLPDGKQIPCILLANKCDQPKQGMVTTPAKLDEYVKEHGFAGWFETSARDNINVEEAAKSLVTKILMNDKQISAGEIVESDRFTLGHSRPDANQKKSCAC
ncbi:uncharacterized protein LOC129754075 isoform X1 [Uranotaenia lowii]|uniref:uncharacterized protein LOC129754075 isoform X1 n=2 Tax=Uranotaenia lowii TaxID=190385 RepID=UPI00247A9E88|nr:uncharacterized protein LOC129754075 isoform X1 [Uranotaenia lowii]